ncbi:hypothetical protein ACO0LB_16980 [Undibacterium sp. SXout7W]|uniref:hypothetical protein n=1 Tax=Undibacterium sp. SXout7W TaxID=3413049 RepID=UPI003BF2679F
MLQRFKNELQSIIALLLIGTAGFKCIEMFLTDDLSTGLSALSAIVAGVLVELASYIKKDAFHLRQLRLTLLTLALLANISIGFVASDMYYVHKFFN